MPTGQNSVAEKCQRCLMPGLGVSATSPVVIVTVGSLPLSLPFPLQIHQPQLTSSKEGRAGEGIILHSTRASVMVVTRLNGSLPCRSFRAPGGRGPESVVERDDGGFNASATLVSDVMLSVGQWRVEEPQRFP